MSGAIGLEPGTDRNDAWRSSDKRTGGREERPRRVVGRRRKRILRLSESRLETLRSRRRRRGGRDRRNCDAPADARGVRCASASPRGYVVQRAVDAVKVVVHAQRDALVHRVIRLGVRARRVRIGARGGRAGDAEALERQPEPAARGAQTVRELTEVGAVVVLCVEGGGRVMGGTVSGSREAGARRRRRRGDSAREMFARGRVDGPPRRGSSADPLPDSL